MKNLARVNSIIPVRRLHENNDNDVARLKIVGPRSYIVLSRWRDHFFNVPLKR